MDSRESGFSVINTSRFQNGALPTVANLVLIHSDLTTKTGSVGYVNHSLFLLFILLTVFQKYCCLPSTLVLFTISMYLLFLSFCSEGCTAYFYHRLHVLYGISYNHLPNLVSPPFTASYIFDVLVLSLIVQFVF
jgi:hypothetical protein